MDANNGAHTPRTSRWAIASAVLSAFNIMLLVNAIIVYGATDHYGTGSVLSCHESATRILLADIIRYTSCTALLVALISFFVVFGKRKDVTGMRIAATAATVTVACYLVFCGWEALVKANRTARA